MSRISERIEQVKDNIAAACDKAGRAVSDVRIIVVTKSADIEDVKEVIGLGFTELGESRVQHLKTIAAQIDEFLLNKKQPQGSATKINWHMIGHLQRNKIRQALELAGMIQTVDTLRLAEGLNKAATETGQTAKVLMQVNCSKEEQKYGVSVGAAIHLAEQIADMPNVKLCGLMTMAELTKDESVIRAAFERAKELFEDIKRERIGGEDFVHLSMGMSNDYQIAVEEGATMLRIGSAIFA